MPDPEAPLGPPGPPQPQPQSGANPSSSSLPPDGSRAPPMVVMRPWRMGQLALHPTAAYASALGPHAGKASTAAAAPVAGPPAVVQRAREPAPALTPLDGSPEAQVGMASFVSVD